VRLSIVESMAGVKRFCDAIHVAFGKEEVTKCGVL
jgi:hypothetical protein